MSLSILCGDFQPSLEEAFLRRLAEAPPGPARRVAVVTPSRRLSDRLQRLAAGDHGLALFNIRFHTFYSLALEAAEEALAGRALVMEELFHDRLIDACLRRRAGAAGSRGLSSAYRSTVHDLLEAGVEPEQFREFFSTLLTHEDDRARLGGLLALLQDYQARLEEIGVLPFPGLVKLAARAVEEGRAPALDAYAEFLYYGFYDLNSVQADFFSAVARAHPVSVFFPYREDHPAFQFVRPFYQVKLLVGGPRPRHLPAERRGRALGAALESLFDPSRPPPERVGEDRLRIISVSGVRDEVWRVAKEILALRDRSGGPVEFHEIGVVARTLEPYRAALAEVFEENAIPYSAEAPEPLLRFPLAKLALTLLALRRRDFPADALLDLVESPYWRMERYAGRADGRALAARWKRVVRRTGVHSGWLQWEGKVAPWAEKDLPLDADPAPGAPPGPVIDARDTAALWGLLQDLRRRLDPAAAPRGWAALAGHARALLRDCFSAAEDDPVWRAVLEAVEGLKALDRFDPEATLDAFIDALEEKFRRATLAREPARRGVRVLGAMDARGESFRVLFLIGLQEGLFPRQIREDPLLRDPVRSLLQQPAGYWILPKLAGYEEEKLLFYLMAASAGERLYCLYPRSDDAGRAQVPSIYLRELCRAAGRDLEEKSNERVPRPPLVKYGATDPGLLSPKEISLLLAQERPPAVFPGPRADALRSALSRAEDFGRFGDPGPLDGIIGRPEAYLRRLAGRGLSPSALDVFAACPFQFYAGRVLGLPDPEEASGRGDMAARVRGRLYHAILQRFHQDLLASGFWSRSGEDWRPALEKAIGEVFTRAGWRELGLYPLLWESHRRRMASRLGRFAAWDVEEIRRSGLVPAYFEQPLRAPFGEGGLELRGRLDRVDRDAAGRVHRIVDYKSRWPAQRKSLEALAASGRAHQPLLYLEMAARSPQFPSGAELKGAFFYILESEEGEEPMQAFPAEVWQARRGALLEGVSARVERIGRGLFPIRPDEARGGACGFCGFGLICRKNHPASRRRAAAGDEGPAAESAEEAP